jgi:hypothetical protein
MDVKMRGANKINRASIKQVSKLAIDRANRSNIFKLEKLAKSFKKFQYHL